MFPFGINLYLGKILWDHANILFALQLLLADFSSHWWILPAKSITLVFYFPYSFYTYYLEIICNIELFFIFHSLFYSLYSPAIMYSWVFILWVRIQSCHYCVAQIFPLWPFRAPSDGHLCPLDMAHLSTNTYSPVPQKVSSSLWFCLYSSGFSREKEYIYSKAVVCAVIKAKIIRSAVSKLETQKNGWYSSSPSPKTFKPEEPVV